MVVNRFDSTPDKECHPLTSRHTCGLICNARSEGIEEESFKGVVVECAVCVRYIEAVVARMECCCFC